MSRAPLLTLAGPLLPVPLLMILALTWALTPQLGNLVPQFQALDSGHSFRGQKQAEQGPSVHDL